MFGNLKINSRILVSTKQGFYGFLREAVYNKKDRLLANMKETFVKLIIETFGFHETWNILSDENTLSIMALCRIYA
jgi:hypothetical protein